LAGNTASNLVFRGAEGTGAAQIFGREGNPLKALAQVKANEANQATLLQKRKEARDKKMADLAEWAPDERWAPFDEQVRTMAEDLMGWEVEQIQAGADTSDVGFTRQVKSLQNKANLVASKSNHMKTVFDDVRKTYTEGDKKDYFQTKHYDELLNDVFMDENGNGNPIDQINLDDARSILDDPEGYNITAITNDFIAELPEKSKEFYSGLATKLGQGFEQSKFMTKVLQFAPDGSLEFDDNNQPVLRLAPEVIREAMNNDLLGRWVDYETGREVEKRLQTRGLLDAAGVPSTDIDPVEEQEIQKEILRGLLIQRDPTSMSKKPTGMLKHDTAGGRGFSVQEPLVDVRYRTLRKAIYSLDESALKEAAQAAGGIQIEFLGGEPGPGGKLVDEASPDRIRVTIDQKGFEDQKRGQEGEKIGVKPKVKDIYIGDNKSREAAIFELNQLMDEAQGAAKLRIGNDNIRLFHERWLKKNSKNLGFGGDNGKVTFGFK